MNEKKSYLVYIVLAGALLLVVGGAYLFGRSHGHTEGRAEAESLRNHLETAREINSQLSGELKDYRNRVYEAELRIESLEAGNAILAKRLIEERGTIEEIGDLAREGGILVEEIRGEIRKGNPAP